ncbi:DUF6806 family protein [Candidatus Symbiobacter mobilis]|uniref:Uncharacterized protein n=1 Tax=Candidatus Symbiobacter mobilis CR TaxID=946483 RepID=U5NDE8_9BURK|nr:DUF6806 family protein [Candidatus Symbiobacter mobilis]AGX88268.1 hypothetical protein Cenrod_2200 [Candidatus Symbiobacter mobilis CR]
MPHYESPLEIHVHGQVALRRDVGPAHLEEALQPLWRYTGSPSLWAAAQSCYEDEPGIAFIADQHLLQMCWTVVGAENFRQALDEMCMNLNDLSIDGAVLEVTFYDTRYDEEDDEEDEEEPPTRDDFFLLFIGPDPGSIMQVQRDLLVQDVVELMERHFDRTELEGIVQQIDLLFQQRLSSLVNSLQLGKPPRGGGAPPHAGGRKPRKAR